MRTRFLLIIASFVLISIGMNSCLWSDEVSEYSTDATMYSFSLDTIHGVEYKFDIDHTTNLIYNLDSLPIDADTIIDSILVTIQGGYYISSADTIFDTDDYQNMLPAVNQSGSDGMKFTVHAVDGVTTRTYTLQIRMHQQDPDSLTWVNMDTIGSVFSTALNPNDQKAIIQNGKLLLYTSPTQMYMTSTAPNSYGWSEAAVSGLPSNADVTTLIGFEGRLYMLADGDVYVSNTSGTEWEKSESLSGNIESLVASIPEDEVMETAAALVGIRINTDNGNVEEFCITEDGETWEAGDTVPEGFPTYNISYTTQTNESGTKKAVVMGMPLTGDVTIPWFSMDGKSWASLETSSDMYCPALENPFITYYGEQYYAFGGDMDSIYSAPTAIAWTQIEEKFMFPEEFNGKGNYTAVMEPTVGTKVPAEDKRDFIWVIFGGKNTQNEVWRGRLNKLGFERQ